MDKPVRSRFHALMDYPASVLLIAAPWVFGFSDVGGVAVVLPVAVGVMALLQALLTDWELSLANLIPLPAHLMADVVVGVVLAASPFIFGFSDEGLGAWLPHVIAGIALIGLGLLTEREPRTDNTAIDMPSSHP